MKIVINNTYNTFTFVKACEAACGHDIIFSYSYRTNPDVIKWVEEHPTYEYDPDDEEDIPDLEVLEIPDEATDWIVINDIDGLERLIYVLDGKINFSN